TRRRVVWWVCQLVCVLLQQWSVHIMCPSIQHLCVSLSLCVCVYEQWVCVTERICMWSHNFTLQVYAYGCSHCVRACVRACVCVCVCVYSWKITVYFLTWRQVFQIGGEEKRRKQKN